MGVPPAGGVASQGCEEYVTVGNYRDSVHLYFLLLTALNDKRSSQKKRDIVNEFFERLESEILRSPKDYMASFWSTFLVIDKSRKIDTASE